MNNDSVHIHQEDSLLNNEEESVSDFKENHDSMVVTPKTALADTVEVKVDSVFKPDPLRSVWLGAVIPGYGQIVNRKYWKLPIVYGSFLGCAYAISWNNSRYVSYKNAYRDISDSDPTTNYHLKILPRGYNIENFPGGISTYTARLKSAQDQFRQWRDLSIIISVGVYALSILEAYVDAQLYDFDITPDLVFNVAPARIDFNQHQNTRSAYGVQWSFRF
ncbi:MAG: hypothetical protein GX361_01395 [Bacteroidales bacterium]|nr:hypothetical protein [Bacteroidales bacterium]